MSIGFATRERSISGITCRDVVEILDIVTGAGDLQRGPESTVIVLAE